MAGELVDSWYAPSILLGEDMCLKSFISALPDMANGFGVHARSLPVEFGTTSAHYRILKGKFERALLDADQHIREASQRYLARMVIGYHRTIGGAFLVADYDTMPWSHRSLFIHPERFDELVLAGDELYVVLADAERKRTLAHVCDLSLKRLEAEGLSVHPFSFTAVRQAQQGLPL